ncbi:MAG: DUF1778 domain-containing protein [Gammaproteobacteria bacterium]
MKSQQTLTGKTKRLEARISAEQKKLFQHAAHLSGRSLTDFTIHALQEMAKKIIEEHRIIRLSADEQTAFANVLLNPPAPHKNLVNAVKRYRKHVKSTDE